MSKKQSKMVALAAEQQKLAKELQRVFTIFKSSEAQLRPHLILSGESGSGKTQIINHLCEEHKMGMIEINAAQLTKEGTAGNSLSKALAPLLQFGQTPVVVFVDEFDKLFISNNSNSSLAHETTHGVQNEFLKVLESDTTEVYGDYGKYLKASTANVLYIFAGAFNGEKMTLDRLREIGIKTEFLGRIAHTYHTERLSLESLLQILNDSPLLARYLQLFQDVKKEEVIETITPFVVSAYELNTLGARLINSLIHQYFIKGGDLGKPEESTEIFQKKLEL